MSERLDLLRPFLSTYRRRFTVLDFGAGINVPSIGAEIAREFDAVVVCVEKDIVAPENSPRTIWLKKQFSLADLTRMSECEYFDVVIGFNVAHWFGEDSVMVAETLRRMGHYVFLQSPHGVDTKAIEAFGGSVTNLNYYFERSGLDWKHLGDTVQFPQHTPRPLWMFDNRVDRDLTRTHVDAPNPDADIRIEAYRDRCRAKIHDRPWKDWIAGINLYNFKQWNGVYPMKEYVVKALKEFKLPTETHGDVTMHNFIFDGQRVYLVDGHEGWHSDDKVEMETVIDSFEHR